MRKNYNTQITLCVYILFMVCSWGLTPLCSWGLTPFEGYAVNPCIYRTFIVRYACNLVSTLLEGI